jgi:hypothetical protein
MEFNSGFKGLMQDDQKDEITRTWPKVRYPIEVTTKVQNEQTA